MGAMFRQDAARLAIFSGLDPVQLQQIEPILIGCRFHKGQTIFQQGQPAQFLYILQTGAVTVHYKPYDGPILTVANIQSEGVFGWSAALGREIYTSSALAVEDSTALSIRADKLMLICRQHPDTGKILLDRLAGVIAERLHNTHTQVMKILCQQQERAAVPIERNSNR